MDLVLRAVHSKGKCKRSGLVPSRQRNVYSPYAHALFNVRGRNPVAKPYDKLCNLLDVDDVLVLFIRTLLTLHRTLRVDCTSTLSRHWVHGNDLRTPRDL